MISLVQRVVAFNEGIPQQVVAAASHVVGKVGCSSHVTPVDCFAFAELDHGIFPVKNPGNLVPKEDLAIGSWAEIAMAVGIRDMIVYGHSDCIAMKELLTDSGKPKLRQWVQRNASEALGQLEMEKAFDRGLSRVDQLSQLNVMLQLRNLREYVTRPLEAGVMRLHGWWYDGKQNKILAFSPDHGKFQVIDQEMGQRIIESVSP